MFTRTFSGDDTPMIELYDNENSLLPDGHYTYEIVSTPILTEAAHDNMEAAFADQENRGLVEIAAEGVRQSGYFHILEGAILSRDLREPAARVQGKTDGRPRGTTPGSPAAGEEEPGPGDVGINDSDDATRDQTFLDDLIVDGSACVWYGLCQWRKLWF